MKQPMEFWVNPDSASIFPRGETGAVRVIEFRAYEEMQLDERMASKEVERQMKINEALRKERDEYRAALETYQIIYDKQSDIDTADRVLAKYPKANK